MISPGLFRLLLATIVIGSHFTKLSIGGSAVYLFFVLSGFWIFRMFQMKYSRAETPYFVFLASRSLRVLPIFLLFNTLALILHFGLSDNVAHSQTVYDFIPNALVLGYSSLSQKPLAPAWSLDIEMQFYIVFPLIYYVMTKLIHYSWRIVTLFVLSGGVYISFFLNRDGADNVLPYLGFFLIGSIAAQSNLKLPTWATRLSPLLSMAFLVTFALLPALRGCLFPGLSPSNFIWNRALNFALALFLAPLALASVHVRSSSGDRLAGDMSYVIYCCHWLAVVIATDFLTGLSRETKAPFVSLLIVAAYAVSYFVLIYVDRPIGRWRERWISRWLQRSMAVT
ncbi:acyltransferase family protein [Lichenicoccus sp.]|uniref:acyltransferase family protein n=1 Tax=Lichenicoccus sp. TaxID=2781899 RepID=UPI003D0ADD03